jgi:hypothetical protein
MPLGPFALTVDGDLMCATEVADAQLGPAMAFGRAYSEPVENGSYAVVRQHARQFANQLLGCLLGLSAILANAVLRHFKPRVVPTLPMQHQVQAICRDGDNDLLEDGPQNPLAGFVGRRGMVP